MKQNTADQILFAVLFGAALCFVMPAMTQEKKPNIVYILEDNVGFATWPLFKESGMEKPMIREGKEGQESPPVMPLDLEVRPVVDRDYIIPKTVEFIKRNANQKTPFFVYVGYSEAHPPIIINEDFAGQSAKRGGKWADMIAGIVVEQERILAWLRRQPLNHTDHAVGV